MSATNALYKRKPDQPSKPMRRSFVPVLVVIGLLVLPALAVAAAPGGRGQGRGPPAPIGEFRVEESSQVATGQHLSFSYSDAGVTDFRAANRTLFDVLVAGSADEEDDDDDGDEEGARAEGAKLRIRTSNYTLVAHDNPSATTKIATDGIVTVTFEDGVVIMRATEEAVRFSFGDVTGVLRGEGLAAVGRTVTAEDELLVFLDAARGSFDKNRTKIGNAIAHRHVGAEATFNAIDGDDVEQEVVSYGNVTMTTVKAEHGNLTVVVEGHGFDGRVLVLNVDGRVIGADAADKLTISLDNLTIPRASNLTDILDPDDDGYAPEFYLVHDPAADAFQLIVTVPHYSVHTLSVTLVDILRPSVVIGILAGTALLVPAALVLFRRK